MARRYPIGMVWNEARFVRRRINQRIKTEAVVMQAAMHSVLSGPKHFSAVLETLDDG